MPTKRILTSALACAAAVALPLAPLAWLDAPDARAPVWLAGWILLALATGYVAVARLANARAGAGGTLGRAAGPGRSGTAWVGAPRAGPSRPGTATDGASPPRSDDAGAGIGPTPAAFERVLEEEIDHLAAHRRGTRSDDELRESLVGLALSGGGIRSATTNLGVLQALSRMGVLPMVDYLSTVSGGGYIGAALSAYLSVSKVRLAPDERSVGGRSDFERAPAHAPAHAPAAEGASRAGESRDGHTANGAWSDRLRFAEGDRPVFTTEWDSFPFRTDTHANESRAAARYARLGAALVGHLRTHGNFLIARKGLLRRETMRSIGAIVTGIAYNIGLFVLTLFTAVALYLAAVLALAPDLPTIFGWGPAAGPAPVTAAPAVPVGAGRTDSLVPVGETVVRRQSVPCADAPGCETESRTTLGVRTVARRVATNLGAVGTYAASEWDTRVSERRTVPEVFVPLVWGLVAGALVTLAMFVRLCLTLRSYAEGEDPASAMPDPNTVRGDSDESRRERRTLYAVAGVLLVTALGLAVGLRVASGREILSGSGPADAARRQLSQIVWLFVPFAVLVAARLTSAALAVAALPQLGGGTQRARSRWGAVQAITMYGSWLMFVLAVLPFVIYALPGGALGVGGSALGSLLLARLLAPRTGAAGQRALSRLAGLRRMLLAIVVVLVIALGILFCGAVVAANQGAAGRPPEDLWMLAGILVGVFALLGFLVDQNAISPHSFYRDRLAETYLHAEVADAGQRMRLFHDTMEMPLQFLHGVSAGERFVGSPGEEPEGWFNPAPYHLISAAINLAGSQDLTRKDRKSGYWLFSKLYCGSTHTGFRPTHWYRGGETRLARAVAISGAAASSGMGFGTHFAQAFATVLFNVRLGYWIENPAHAQSRQGRTPFWPYFLLKEVFMSTRETDWMVNLSDGGHTGDNVGIYPLLQRRCKVIIACDAECDPALNFGSFTEALRHAYIDEGITVDIDLAMVRPKADTGFSTSHCAVGRIFYPDRPHQKSYLIYLKNSLTGDEQEPVLNYKSVAADFPHETTADQFFDDAQFESYRALGVHIAETTFEGWVGTAPFDFAREYHGARRRPARFPQGAA